MDEFEKWNRQKKIIDAATTRIFYREREIRWCRLGRNIGSEQRGSGQRFERPVLIVRALSRETCIIVPLTTSSKMSKFRLRLDKESVALLSQIKIVDIKRLTNVIKVVDEKSFRTIKKAIRNMFR